MQREKGWEVHLQRTILPTFLRLSLEMGCWMRWLPLFCWCNYRQPLGICSKYRLSLIKSSTIALSNLWTVFLRHEQCPRLLRQDDTCADLVQSHYCLVLGIECLEHHFRGIWPHQRGSVAHPHVCIFNLIQDAQKWQWGKSHTCSLVWQLGNELVSSVIFFYFILFSFSHPTHLTDAEYSPSLGECNIHF